MTLTADNVKKYNFESFRELSQCLITAAKIDNDYHNVVVSIFECFIVQIDDAVIDTNEYMYVIDVRCADEDSYQIDNVTFASDDTCDAITCSVYATRNSAYARYVELISTYFASVA